MNCNSITEALAQIIAESPELKNFMFLFLEKRPEEALSKKYRNINFFNEDLKRKAG